MTALLLIALFQSTAPVASFTAPSPPAKAVTGTPNKDGLICRKEAVIGSRMKTRTCMSQEQWDARAADDRELVEQAQRNKPLQSN